MRRLAGLAGLLVLLALLPEGSLACERPVWSSAAPDGGETLTACARPMWVAMPGQGSDADGWVVLRDAHGLIRGVVGVGLIRQAGGEAEWTPAEVSVPLVAGFARAPQRPWPLALLIDRHWRLRALLGLTPTDAAFR